MHAAMDSVRAELIRLEEEAQLLQANAGAALSYADEQNLRRIQQQIEALRRRFDTIKEG